MHRYKAGQILTIEGKRYQIAIAEDVRGYICEKCALVNEKPFKENLCTKYCVRRDDFTPPLIPSDCYFKPIKPKRP